MQNTKASNSKPAKGKGREGSTVGASAKPVQKEEFVFVLQEVSSHGWATTRHCDHSLLRALKGMAWNDFRLHDDLVQRMVAALDEEGGDGDEKKRDGFHAESEDYRYAVLLDFMGMFGTTDPLMRTTVTATLGTGLEVFSSQFFNACQMVTNVSEVVMDHSALHRAAMERAAIESERVDIAREWAEIERVKRAIGGFQPNMIPGGFMPVPGGMPGFMPGFMPANANMPNFGVPDIARAFPGFAPQSDRGEPSGAEK